MSTSFNFDYLPADVLYLSGYDFFQFIKTVLGEPEANLLDKISIKSTKCLIQTEDPLDIFNYDIDDEELEMLKSELSFKLKNKKFMVKPGVIAGFRSLKDALRKKINEQSTKPKGRKQHQQLFNTSSSSIYSLVPVAATQAPSLSNKSFSLAEHKAHVLKLIHKWCSDNKENFDLEHFDLQENFDFFLNIDYDESTDVKASLKCKCNKLILLSKNDNKIQVSNYYKHLQSNGCNHMKNLKKAAKELKLSRQQQQQSTPVTLTPSNRSNTSSTEVTTVSPTNAQTTTQMDSSALPNKTVHNGGKRRLIAQSQQYPSTKRSRI
ncbi:unnamed protein product [Rotaria sp. Silwood2]|nr:unnamed protein product [Rotaria sp. Silwood2]CAF3482115.1 unnamed protein product [Rotaria sp. Silwood2]CAF4449796.1 unnamed protein product [Rotaria sp. Silwood2]CAF4656733.1 unnamed protein product [Rotaria sp. Silwood2]